MKSILITGASSGFGRAAALELAKLGWLVFATMRNPAKAKRLLSDASEAGCTGQIELLALDVTDEGSIDAAMTSLLKRTGGTLDSVLCNAGYSILGAFEDCTDADCRQQMETNFFGTLAVARKILPIMREARRGRLIVVTSNAVNSPHPMLSMYAASKWALEGWAEGVAMEVAPFGIDVCVVEPGAHRTEFASNVAFIQPEGSPYREWLEAVMPGIGKLDQWGRDPAKGSNDIVAAVCAPNVPFRQQIGEDAKIFAALKGIAPYETRAAILRAITGVPHAGAFGGTLDKGQMHPILAEVLAEMMKNSGNADALAAAVAASFGLGQA